MRLTNSLVLIVLGNSSQFLCIISILFKITELYFNLRFVLYRGFSSIYYIFIITIILIVIDLMFCHSHIFCLKSLPSLTTPWPLHFYFHRIWRIQFPFVRGFFGNLVVQFVSTFLKTHWWVPYLCFIQRVCSNRYIVVPSVCPLYLWNSFVNKLYI